LRGGGGGNFGIVTDMIFETHKLDTLLLYEIYFEPCQLKMLLKKWQKFAPFAPNDLASKLCIHPGKDILMKGQYIGESSELEKLLAPFIRNSKSHRIWRSSVYQSALYNNDSSENPPWYFFYQTLFVCQKRVEDDVSDSRAVFVCQKRVEDDVSDSRAVFSHLLNNDVIDVLVNFVKGVGIKVPHNFCIIINALGGRFGEIDKEDTAFYWRDAKLWLHLASETKDQMEYESMKASIQEYYYALLNAGLAIPGEKYGMLYINFKDLSLSPKEYMNAYYGENRKRLLEIKKKYDPNNVFSGLQTIPVLGNDAKVLPFGF